jgi:hypothetical protein
MYGWGTKHVGELFKIATEHGFSWGTSDSIIYFDDALLAKAVIPEQYFPAQFIALRDGLKLRKTEFNTKFKEFKQKAKKKARNGNGNGSSDPDEDGDNKPLARRLIDRAVEEGMQLYKTANRDSIAAVDTESYGTHYYDVDDGSFCRWLDGLCLVMTGLAPPRDTKKQALDTIHAMAQRDGDLVQVHVRVAKHSVGGSDKHYLDLCNEDGDVIEFGAEGWKVVSEPPVVFMRYENMLALPMPQRPADNAEALRWLHDGLMLLLNIEEADYMLVVPWLLGAMRQLGGYYILAINGPKGSAKTTGAKVIRNLIDPYAALPGGEPHDERSYYISCFRRHIPISDNLSSMRRDRSDVYCRVATGSSYEAKTNYRDKENTVLSVCRPQIITAINNVAKADDLIDRCQFIKLKEIPKSKKRGDEEMEQLFRAHHPKILGALLHIACRGLANGDHVETGDIRMIDYERIAKKSEPYYRVNGATFSKSNKAANTEVHEETLAGELTFQCMLDVMKPRDGCYSWDNGRMQELYFEMDSKKWGRTDEHFPANAIHLGRWFTRRKDALEAIGCLVKRWQDKKGSWVAVALSTETHNRLSRQVISDRPSESDRMIGEAYEQLHQDR